MPVRVTLLLFELRDHLLAGAGDVSELVELFVDAITDEPAIARQRRRFVLNRLLDPLTNICQVVELAGKAHNERRLTLGKQDAYARDRRQRLAQAQRDRAGWRSRARLAKSAVRGPERVFSASRTFPRSVVRNANSSTASRRSRIDSSATSGRSSHDRIIRPPIAVIVRSISWSSEPSRPPLTASTTSRCSSVVGSISRPSAACLCLMVRTWARSAFCVSRR